MSTDPQTTILALSPAPADTAEASVEGRLAALERQLAQQQSVMFSQQAVIENLQAELSSSLPTGGEPNAADSSALLLPGTVRRRRKSGTEPSQPTKRSSRRKLLQLGGAAAAAGVAAGALSLANGAPAAHAAPAATGDNFILGQFNTAATNTELALDVTQVVTADSVLVVGAATNGGVNAVVAFSHNATGVGGNDDAGGTGVLGTSFSGVGVFGQSNTNIGLRGFSDSSSGVYGFSNSNYGGAFVSNSSAQLYLSPGSVGAPSSGTHYRGEIYLDGNGVLWVCVVGNGTNLGTWVRLTGVANGASGGATTFLSTPIRLLDTRVGASGAASTPNAKIQPGAPNTFHLPVAGVSFGGSSIPAGARALVGNCTVVNPVGVGDLAAYPDLLPLPNTAVMHFLAGQIVSNGITIGLGSNGKLAITALGSATDVIIDCQGFIM